MNIPLDNFFDTHFIHVDRGNETTLNIVIRARIDRPIDADILSEALTFLQNKHCYLSAKVVKKIPNDGAAPFELRPVEVNHLDYDVLQVPSGHLDTVMNCLSEFRYHRFNLYSGQLIHIQVWHDNANSIIEFSCAHLLGDITSAMLIMNDILNFISISVEKKTPNIDARERLEFSIDKLANPQTNSEPQNLSLQDVVGSKLEMWPQPEYSYQRHSISLELFKRINTILRNREINATPIDLFYYFAADIYSKYGIELDLTAIFSFRKHLKEDTYKDSINTFAIFSPLAFPYHDIKDIKYCLEKINNQRRMAIELNGVTSVLNFINRLNELVGHKDIINTRNIINSFIQIKSTFCYNNLGIIDDYFKDRPTFKVIDIDIQDGVPAEEVRMFSYRNTVNINPMLRADGPISATQFWEEFLNRLENFERSF